MKIKKVNRYIEASCGSIKIDYFEIVNFKTLIKAEKKDSEILLALAVYIGHTRLIDNLLLNK